jgi:hypothetical protein
MPVKIFRADSLDKLEVQVNAWLSKTKAEVTKSDTKIQNLSVQVSTSKGPKTKSVPIALMTVWYK